MRNKVELLLSTLVDIAKEMAKESYEVEKRNCNRNVCCDREVPCCFNELESKPHFFDLYEQPRMEMREPDGVDIHVDRPLRENYFSHHKWAVDMANYRTLIDCAKKCDWPCKEPMKGVPANAMTRDWYDENPHRW